jgi:Zn-dependent protease with chaperone function
MAHAFAAAGVLLWAALVPDWAWLVHTVVPPLVVWVPPGAVLAALVEDAVVFTVLTVMLACATGVVASARSARDGARRPAPPAPARLSDHLRRVAVAWAVVLPFCLLFQHVSRTLPLLTVPVAALAAASSLVAALWMVPWFLAWSPRVTPLRDEALTGRLHALVSRAGLRVAGMHEWRMDSAGVEPNAALIGLGSGRRLLLSTALVDRLDPDALDVVVAHELGHHARGHLWRRIGAAVLTLTAALVGAQVMALLAAWGTGLRTGDPSLVPWALLGAGAVWLAARPRWLAQSRAHEREADRFSLDVTNRPDVLEAILRRLSAEGHDLDAPTPFDEAFFLTHPSVAERVALARAWQPSPRADSHPARGDRMAAP